ncbi:MAG TPA: hypothetical protein VKT53_06595 [Candidatus Acidoferrum sp.]|nr:hypothetical protein [Candidatus Acidoferrum sp.]
MSKSHDELLETPRRRGLSLESWVALIAFTVAALVRAGVFKHLPW